MIIPKEFNNLQKQKHKQIFLSIKFNGNIEIQNVTFEAAVQLCRIETREKLCGKIINLLFI